MKFLYEIVLLFSTTLGLISTFSLIISARSSRVLNGLFIVFILSISAFSFLVFCNIRGVIPDYIFLIRTLFPLYYFVPPAIYLYMKYYLYDQPRLNKKGQSYLFGNKGGTSISDGGYGGWGGGGQGGPVIPAKYGLGGGSGGGGGGYSGGSSSYSTMVTAPKEMLPRVAASGGGGGSYVSPKSFAVGLTKTAGFNEGNGSVRIFGPRTLVQTVRTTQKTYTWIRNKVSYSSNGVYEYVDSTTATTYILNLTLFNLVQGPGPSPASPGGSLMAFPNPSDGKMKLRLPRAEQQTILEILSMDGRLIKEYKIAPFTTAMELDLRHLGSGVYVFRLRGEGNDEWFRSGAIWLRTQQIKVVIQ